MRISNHNLSSQDVLRKISQVTRMLGVIEISKMTHAMGMIVLIARWKKLELQFNCILRPRSTPQQIAIAIQSAKENIGQYHPLVIVPYLSERSLESLEHNEVSGVDLCGNGLIQLPGTLFIRMCGRPNLFPERSPVKNPYRGIASIVTRALLHKSHWNSLGELHNQISKGQIPASLSMCCKVLQVLVADGRIAKHGGSYDIVDRSAILDELAREWGRRRPTAIIHARINKLDELPARLKGMRWCASGLSSAVKSSHICDVGPMQIIVEDANKAMNLCAATPEDIPAFANIVFVQHVCTTSIYDANADDDGFYWASRLQTWIELQAGDARQREAARGLYGQVLSGNAEHAGPHPSQIQTR